MVKIKTKREMTLPELIQWGWKNGEEHRIFYGSKDGEFCFHDDSWVTIETAVEPGETFTVEVEEEITEDTVIPMLIEVTEYNDDTTVFLNENKSIKTVLDDFLDDLLYDPKAFCILNDDYTMTLIWRNGEMVE
ncbi:hypothetical protein [Staphylococcus agnetis]|uniref:hypothetical protein n=1 Tax=Staphylococcus agnetis TaxID=985762 RepID=UPI0004E31F97|nr:hypothetical protein [Staphylococcus agnetis]KFE41952.1 hypothetical protein SAGN_06005 [Staphylococcus agnetis]NJH66042.1 hypothetical protein [Staphylococcus agnetis]NJH98078.1 hypothetical protein [Staphylococcus agnetis]PTH45900.1 hypothetical protein BU587_09880 [Staphylococcus agnetis]PTH71544.1 hypothetical protein BU581_11810 [Staphylococcus agnetis]